MSISPSNIVPESTIAAHAVFEGGGIRGIAHVGALSVAEQYGYRWDHVAGTSAGAIIASLVAAGYTASELNSIMRSIDYTHFATTPLCDPLHLSDLFQLLAHNGLHNGSYIEEFVREKLAAKDVHTFGDLLSKDPAQLTDPFLRYRLTIIASDITHTQMLRLPQDVRQFGLDPDALDVALAVRMSASIPFFFEPIILKHTDGCSSCIVDGGLLSNYPLFLFEQAHNKPDIPTFGFRLVDSLDTVPCIVQRPYTPVELGKALLDTMLSAHDKLYINDEKYVCTIAIPVHGISTTQFNLTYEQVQLLYNNGVHAAQTFFETWDFTAYKQNYGSGDILDTSRLAQLHQRMKSR